MPRLRSLDDAPRPLASEEIARLVDRARQGDLPAFDRLIGEYQAKVYTFAFAFTGDPEEAKDLAQEALVKVYRALGGFRFQCSFSTWLYAIVKNSYLDQRKSRAAQERRAEQPLDAEVLEKLEQAATAEEALIGAEARALLLHALREVEEPFRMVVMLADVQGLDYEAISQVLALPLGTIKSRLSRGREALRAVLHARREEEEMS
jgi:RNA polymerase sigma-70 factor (ECF subfamily)